MFLVADGPVETDVLPREHPGAVVGGQLVVAEFEIVRPLDRDVLGDVQEGGRPEPGVAVGHIAGDPEVFRRLILQIDHSRWDWY